MTGGAPPAATAGPTESLPALTLTPLQLVVPEGMLYRVTMPAAAALLNGLFGAQAWLALQLLVALNPSAYTGVGGVGLVRSSEVPTGDGAGWILAPFVRAPGLDNGSRFSDGSYGVWYGADSVPTAQAEVGYHLARWLAKTQATPDRLERSVVVAYADPARPLIDLRAPGAAPRDVLHPDHYAAARAFGATCRRADFWGLLWPSVRAEGVSAGIFRPRALQQAHAMRTCHATWDGARVTWA